MNKVTLSDLLKHGVKAGTIATLIESHGIRSYDRFRIFLPTKNEKYALDLLLKYHMWSVDEIDPDYEDSRSPLLLTEIAETFEYEKLGWIKGDEAFYQLHKIKILPFEDEDE